MRQRQFKIRIEVPMKVDVFITAPSKQAVEKWFMRLGDGDAVELIMDHGYPEEVDDAKTSITSMKKDEAVGRPTRNINSKGEEE